MHPRWTAAPDDHLVVEVALAMKPGMGGWGPLPFAGGYADQPAKLMAACRYLTGLALRLEKERQESTVSQ